MKKLTAKIVIIGILLLGINIQTSLAAFSDLSSIHPNYDAIIFLQENGILNGYPDGTFRPDNSVNRAEFLKITIEGSNIPTDIINNTPFSDIDNSQWYVPYVKKAYAEGWVVGYPDGTFKPEQTINKVEALKIVGEVQNWNLDDSITERPFDDTPIAAWFTRYVDYAKNHGYLEETGTAFNPGELMTRAGISEIIFRTFSSIEETTTSNTNTTSSNDQSGPEENTNPVDFFNYTKDFYENITLSEIIPNIFYENEVYILEGDIISGNYDEATAFLDPDNNNESDYISFSGEVINNHFEIPIYFSESGNYNLGLIPGENGTSTLLEVSIMSNLPNSTETASPEQITNMNIDYKDDSTFVSFSSSPSTIKKLHFNQSGKEVIYVLRQNTDEISVQYSDFLNFNTSPVSYYIESANINSNQPLEISSLWSKNSEKVFTPIGHSFSTISDNKINAGPPDTISFGNSITFNGQVETDAQFTAFIIKPNGFVDSKNLITTSQTTTYFGITTLPSGSDFQFNYTPQTTGRYIVEINNNRGIPILNHAVYVGNIIPLLPDFFDLNEREFFTGTFNLNSLRLELLNLINDSRIEHGIPIAVMDNNLNNLAQSHSEDMATNNYFSHVNLFDQTPEDRRVAAGLTIPVSENIARDVSIEFAHFGLMRSAAHRENIIDPDWESVGLGITLDDEGYIIVTEEFSTGSLTESDFKNLEDELLEEIQSTRDNHGVSRLNYNNNLDQVSTYLNGQIINFNKSLTNESFQDALNQYNVTGLSQAIGRISNQWTDILTSIINQESTIFSAAWTSIGIDVQTDSLGTLNTMFILNDQ